MPLRMVERIPLRYIGIQYNMKREITEKPLAWEGSSYRDLRSFPREARKQAGYELGQVQLGEHASHWKPMPSIGPGATEIKIKLREDAGTQEFRVIYVANFKEAIYVLHSFQKKTQRTSAQDVAIAKRRYSDVMAARGRS